MELTDYLYSGVGLAVLFWPALYGMFVARGNIIWFVLFCVLVFLMSYLLVEIMVFPIVVWLIKFAPHFIGYEIFYSIAEAVGFMIHYVFGYFWVLYIAVPVMVHLRVRAFARPDSLGVSGFLSLLAKVARHSIARPGRGHHAAPLD